MSISCPKRLIVVALLSVLFLVAAPVLSAATVYSYPLPTTNLNSAAGPNRSNASVVQGSFPGTPPTPYIVGDDFVLGTTQTINSLTVYAIANSPTSGAIDTLGQELSTVTLYTGAYTGTLPGSTLTAVQTLTSAMLNADPRVQYNGTTDYESLNTAGTFYPIYAITFTNLNWTVPAGQLEFFGVSGAAIGGNTFNLSASFDTDTLTYDPFFFYTGSPYAPTFQDQSNSITGFNGQAVVNVSMDTSSVPEPSTLGFLGLGIAGLVLKLRRRA